MIPEHIRGLIFDCDGTLADTMPAHYRSWAAATKKYGLTFPEERFYSLGGTPSHRIIAILAEEQGVEVNIKAAAIEKEEMFLEWLPGVQAIAPIYDVAKAQRGQRAMAVASGGYRRFVTAILQHIGVHEWFATIVTAEDTTRHKPEPDVFLEAARRIDVSPEQCLVYEDTDIGLEAARRAGMICFDVRTVWTPARVSEIV